MSPRSRRIGLAAASVILALACAKKAEEKAPAPAPPPPRPPVAASVQVTEVQLGNGIGADKRVSAPLDVFAPTDTIYASVATAGSAPRATLTARFTYQDGQPSGFEMWNSVTPALDTSWLDSSTTWPSW